MTIGTSQQPVSTYADIHIWGATFMTQSTEQKNIFLKIL